MNNDEFSSQVTRKHDEIKRDLYSQILEAIITAFTDQVLPYIQNTLGEQGRRKNTVANHQCSGLYRNPEARNVSKTHENCRKMVFKLNNGNQLASECSIDSQDSDEDYDIPTLFFPTL